MSEVMSVSRRDRKKQLCWPNEVNTIINRARALTKYRGFSEEVMDDLRMNLANAIAEYDSRPNSA
jgi:hypothetical protein